MSSTNCTKLKLDNYKKSCYNFESASNKCKTELFENLECSNKKVDDKIIRNALSVFFNLMQGMKDDFFLSNNEYFNEIDAAKFLRLPDPEKSGKETIRNYALRSNKLPFAKIGRNKLLFHKKDLIQLFQILKVEKSRSI